MTTTLKQMATEIDTIKSEIVSCHGKLKDKLDDNGISTSPGDKLSILIDKIEIGGGVSLKVKTGSRLPSQVENYTIFVETDNSINNAYIQSEQPVSLTTNDIFVKTTNSASGTKVELVDKNINTTIYIEKVSQYINNNLSIKNAWIGIDNSWVQCSKSKYIVFSNDITNLDSENKSNWESRDSVSQVYPTSFEMTIKASSPKHIKVRGDGGRDVSIRRVYALKQKIDLSPYKTIFFRVKKRVISYAASAYFGVVLSDDLHYPDIFSKIEGGGTVDSEELISVDISTARGEGRVCLAVEVENTRISEIFVSEIYLV